MMLTKYIVILIHLGMFALAAGGANSDDADTATLATTTTTPPTTDNVTDGEF